MIMKKLISGLLVACLLCLMIPMVGAASLFQDVDEDDWFMEPVHYCAMQELMVGTDETHFSPNAAMDRGMLVTVLYRMADEPEVERSHSFADVADDAYYADAVSWAAANGITFGTSKTTFSPRQAVTREQAACFIARYATKIDAAFLDSDPIAVTFADENAVSAYAKAAVDLVKHWGLMHGDEKGCFLPQKAMTRAECATVLTQLDYKLFPALLFVQNPAGQDKPLECELSYEDTTTLRNILNQSSWEKSAAVDLENFGASHVLLLDGVMYYLEATDGKVSQSVIYINLLTDQEGTMTDKDGTLVAQIFEILNAYAV